MTVNFSGVQLSIQIAPGVLAVRRRSPGIPGNCVSVLLHHKMPFSRVCVASPDVVLVESNVFLHNLSMVGRPPWICAVVRKNPIEAAAVGRFTARDFRWVDGKGVAFHEHVLRLPSAIVVERLLFDSGLLCT